MKFSDKLYVGFQRERYNNSDEPRLLGFAVPYGETKAEKSRMETVDNWSNSSRHKDDFKQDSRIIDNVPIRGFKLLEVVRRYSTSNKLFRVMDPRGFELEISADNLLDLALQCTIVKGDVIEECVWAQSNGVYLLPTTSEQYKYSLKPKGKIEEGCYYVNVGNLLSVFRFEGVYYHTHLDVSHKPVKAHKGEFTSRSGYRNATQELILTEYDTNVVIKMGAKPTYIYTEFVLRHDGTVGRKTIHARKSHFKNLESYDERKLDKEVVDYTLDLTQWTDRQDNYASHKLNKETLFGTNTYYNGFFKSKQEAKAYDYGKSIKGIRGEIVYYSGLTSQMIADVAGGYSSYMSYETTIAPDVVQNFHITDER